MRRTFTRWVRPLPRRSNSCSCKTRKSFGCKASGRSPISSRKRGASVGHFEPANFWRDGSGEGALLVPEKFALLKIEGNGRAIQRHEGASAAPAEIVNGAGDQLLASARFAKHQHSGIGGRHTLHFREHKFQSRAAAYDVIKLAIFIVLINRPKSLEGPHGRTSE